MEFSYTSNPGILHDLELSDPQFVDETAFAFVWRVTRANGTLAALKLYHEKGMGSETTGFDFLTLHAAKFVAEVYFVEGRVALIEWLPGASLGDLTRQGDDEAACQHLVAVAKGIHAQALGLPTEYPTLDRWFQSLFKLKVAMIVSARHSAAVSKTKFLAQLLLSSQEDVRVLHHDNIRGTDRGFCAFDAKGVVGEKTYELANAFRNPKGAPGLVCSPERIERIANLWSQEFDVDKKRLLQWAAAKCALSIAWRARGLLQDDPELDLLCTLLEFAEAA